MTTQSNTRKPRIVIYGTGQYGLEAARIAREAGVDPRWLVGLLARSCGWSRAIEIGPPDDWPGRFDLMEAVRIWDDDHRRVFLAWAEAPWWP